MSAFATLADIRRTAPAGYPRGKGNLIARLDHEGARKIEGTTTRGQRGFLYDIATLPQPIRDALTAGSDAPQSPYQKAIAPQKVEAEGRLAIVLDVRELVAQGVAWSTACRTVADGCSLSAASVKNLWRLVKDRSEGDWLDLLVKRYKGSERHDYPEQIWAAFQLDYGRLEEPAAQASYDRVKAQAEREGWAPMPSLSTLKRRWKDDVPDLVKTQLRKGAKAVGNRLPPAERDRSGMSPMDGWNGDFRLFDNNVAFPDGSRGRFGMYVIQDEFSGMPVSWVMTRSAGEGESTDLICEALKTGFAKYGLPGTMLFDNTRAAANKAVTGGAAFRFRFKIVSEAAGSLPRLGVKPRFAQPYNGRSKLVERHFLDIKERIERDPRLAGSYVGHSPAHKPANFGEVYADFALVATVVEEAMAECIDRKGRRGSTTYGRSHRQAFEEGRDARAVPVRFAGADELRRAFLRSTPPLKVRNGTVRLGKAPHVNRFHSPKLYEFEGQSVLVRYEPRDLTAAVDVEDMEGRTIAAGVPLVEKLGFSNAEDARAYARARRQEIKAVNAATRARQAQAAAILGLPPTAGNATAAAAPRVVAPTRFDAQRKAEAEQNAKADAEADRQAREDRQARLRGRQMLRGEEFGGGFSRAG